MKLNNILTKLNKIMKKITLICFAFLMMSCAKQEPETAKYWLWSSYNTTQDWDERCQKMSDVGIKGLLLDAPVEGYEKVIPIAEKYGIEVHAWLWIMNTTQEVASEHPEWLSVNRNGASLADEKAYVDYYNFMSPILPEVRAHIASEIENICKIEGLKGVSLDYCRYVDVILPRGLWSTYDIVQDKEYSEWDYGYHPAMIEQFKVENGYSPLDVEDPTKDVKWREFRERQISEVANMVSDIVKKSGKIASASPFPSPSVAKFICKQDWSDWNLDIAFPMIYYKFYDEDLDWVEAQVKECLTIPQLNGNVYCGVFTGDFTENNPDKIEEQMQVAIDAGAKGIAIFDYNGLSPEQWSAITKFIKNNP